MSTRGRVITSVLLLAVIVAVIVGCIAWVPRDTPSPGPTDPAQPATSTPAAVVSITVPAGPGTYTWAFAPLQTGGKISGSSDGNTTEGSIESIIKVWLAADYLRQRETVSVATLAELRTMIRESDDSYAQNIYETLGADESTGRMIKLCKLVSTHIRPFWWSLTTTTAADLVRLGWCIASGAAAGPVWTPWLLDVMRTEHHTGHWGIVQGVVPPHLQSKIAYMNGWTQHGPTWTVNCLAIAPTWILAVMTSYIGTMDETHGASVCADVAKQLTSILPAPSPDPTTSPPKTT